MENQAATSVDWISRLAETGTVIAAIVAIAALFIAAREMKENGQQRQREARFIYAKRATKLYDLLKLNEGVFLELDEQLAAKTVDYTQVHLQSILPINFETILHEAKVTYALSKSTTTECPSLKIYEYMSVLKTCKDKYLHDESLPPAARDHSFVRKMTGMHKADGKHFEIAKSLSVVKPYTYLSESLFAQIEKAYEG